MSELRGKTEKYDYYVKRPASTINAELKRLPKAEMRWLWATKEDKLAGAEKVERFRTIRVTMPDGKKHYVNCPRGRYRIVQSEEAFRPTVEGIVLAGQKEFEYVLLYSPERAELQILFGSEVADEVKLGFSIQNSFDSTKAITFGMRLMKGKTWLEVVGWRQICANGLKIRVPLNEARYFSAEKAGKVKMLLEKYARILHTKRAFEHLEATQYIVEAMTLLHAPVAKMIEEAKDFSLEDEKKLLRIVKLHVGKRFAARTLEAFKGEEEKSLWSLYNVLTYASSHDSDLTRTNRNCLMNKAAEMLRVELTRR